MTIIFKYSITSILLLNKLVEITALLRSSVITPAYDGYYSALPR